MNDDDQFAPPGTPGFRLRDDDLLLFDPIAAPCIKHVGDIISLDAAEDKNNTRVCFAERSAMLRTPLRICVARLNPKRFFQANRSCIVNLSHVRVTQVIPSGPKCYLLVLSNDREILVSRRRAVLLREIRAL